MISTVASSTPEHLLPLSSTRPSVLGTMVAKHSAETSDVLGVTTDADSGQICVFSVARQLAELRRRCLR